jgi:hypothetical protein
MIWDAHQGSWIIIQIFFPSRVQGAGSATLSGRKDLRYNTEIKEEKIWKKRDEPYASPLGVSSLRERLGTGYP